MSSVNINRLMYLSSSLSGVLLRLKSQRASLWVRFFMGALFMSSVASAQSSVPQIVSLERGSSFEERHQSLHALTLGELIAAQEDLFVFMTQVAPPDGMARDQYFSLTNDVYDLFVSHGIKPQQLLMHAIQTIPDAQVDIVWRDYCVQKLSVSLLSDEISLEVYEAGYQLLNQLVIGSFPDLQGSALIVACEIRTHDLRQSMPSFLTAKSLGQVALACARNEACPLIDRVTALQVAARFRSSGTLEFVNALLREELSEAPVMLKVSAIAALGELGNSSDLETLQNFRKSSDIRFRTASRVALNKIEERTL